MGLMDKAKEAALKGKQSAQHLAQQGQAKVESVQQSREEAALFKTLGEAYYGEQRKGGDHGAVATALDALDAHFAAAPPPAAPPPEGGVAPVPGTPPAAPPAGDFKLDDV